MERFKNLAETDLAEDLDATETAVAVVDGSVFPSTGTFRVKVNNEIMKCVSITGDDLIVERGAEGSAASTHANNSTIEHILTAGALEQALTDLYQVGGYAARPATTDVRRGTRYYANDVNLGWTFNGVQWDLTHPVYVPYERRIILSDWTAANLHASSLVTNANGVLFYEQPGDGSPTLRYWKKPRPIVPFKMTMIGWAPIMCSSSGFGFGLRDSGTNKFKVHWIWHDGNGPALRIEGWTTNLSGVTSSLLNLRGGEPLFYLQFEDNNTNWIYRFSSNGRTWVYKDEVRNSFLTPDEVVLFSNNQSTSILQSGHAEWLAYWEG